MECNKTVRRPKQPRSIQTKEKILAAAYKLFCQKGYYKTSTNEIARIAGVSIGSVYSYYNDKDTILLEILGRYNESFMHERLNSGMNQYQKDPKMWFRCFIESLVETHKTSKEFNRELQVLCQSMPAVAAVMAKQHEKIRQRALNYIMTFQDMLRVQDLEAAAIVATNLISSTVDQIVFSENAIPDERILNAGVDAIYQYLIG